MTNKTNATCSKGNEHQGKRKGEVRKGSSQWGKEKGRGGRKEVKAEENRRKEEEERKGGGRGREGGEKEEKRRKGRKSEGVEWRKAEGGSMGRRRTLEKGKK